MPYMEHLGYDILCIYTNVVKPIVIYPHFTTIDGWYNNPQMVASLLGLPSLPDASPQRFAHGVL